VTATLAASGQTIVSGGAYGIDAAAHRAALAADGGTIAVLACGPDIPYPASHRDLLDAIPSRGAVISEWPPGTPPARSRFLLRNRIIAALASGTVVIEAAVRGGTIAAARHAGDLGRPLMPVPGPVASAASAGCHALIRRPARRLRHQRRRSTLTLAIGPALASPQRCVVSGRRAIRSCPASTWVRPCWWRPVTRGSRGLKGVFTRPPGGCDEPFVHMPGAPTVFWCLAICVPGMA